MIRAIPYDAGEHLTPPIFVAAPGVLSVDSAVEIEVHDGRRWKHRARLGGPGAIGVRAGAIRLRIVAEEPGILNLTVG